MILFLVKFIGILLLGLVSYSLFCGRLWWSWLLGMWFRFNFIDFIGVYGLGGKLIVWVMLDGSNVEYNYFFLVNGDKVGDLIVDLVNC